MSRESSQRFHQAVDYDVVDVANPVLYFRGKVTTDFHLILSGKVGVTCGKEALKMEVGSFQHLGAEALMD